MRLTMRGRCRFNEWYPSAAKSIKIVCFLTTAYLKSPYCMKEFGIAQAKDKLLVVACEPVREITSVDPSKYPHASTALAYLLGGGQVLFDEFSEQDVANFVVSAPRQKRHLFTEPRTSARFRQLPQKSSAAVRKVSAGCRNFSAAARQPQAEQPR